MPNLVSQHIKVLQSRSWHGNRPGDSHALGWTVCIECCTRRGERSKIIWPMRDILQFNGTCWRELVPYSFPSVDLHTISIISFYLWRIMCGGSVWIGFIEGQTHFSTSWHAPNWVWPSLNQYRLVFVQTSTLPNMEGVACWKTNSRPKVMFGYRIALLCVLLWITTSIAIFRLMFSKKAKVLVRLFTCSEYLCGYTARMFPLGYSGSTL